MAPNNPRYNSIPAFHEKLLKSKRILAICGAGLSAASGLPTFRGAGGLWRNHEATSLATPAAFEDNPGLVWLFYAYRRHMALTAQPNAGHHALAALARKLPGGFLCLSQNVDGLHPRAGHPAEQLRLLHGSLFDIKCNEYCGWIQRDNFDDPFCPALAAASVDVNPGETLPLLDPGQPLAEIPRKEIPKCPNCTAGLQRPGVVWFYESLDEEMMSGVDRWIKDEPVDVVLVIGTSSQVYPAAGYAEKARGKNTSVVTVNLEPEGEVKLARKQDFVFAGDAAVLLPQLLEPIIGKPRRDGTYTP
ncbi:Sir2 family protein [Cercophora newfieldiana]|uniref:Sir2 family protein n=1 Tax=Cercophora newfieldiana TaxID=92897 RepID=A0AA39XVX2_9PEZI|nr:Sir2 family protein [Cercophora newfieldiana]